MKLKILLILFLAFNFMNAQKSKIINNESTSFQIKDKIDNIDFIVFDTKFDEKKPIFLWCQGSLPYSIYVNTKNGMWLIGGGISNFEIQKITKKYHLVVISMPKTPLISDENSINESYWYYGDSKDKNIPSIDFLKADYLENYSKRAIKVLKYLHKQKWVDNTKLVVAGHSQGSKVVVRIAKDYKNVTNLGLFSANPFGRIDQNIRAYRKDAEKKEISWQEADKAIEQEYQFYKDANNSEKLKNNPNLIAWKSFSEPFINDLLKINKPIYLAYGTNDIASDLCDLVPLYFIKSNNNNLTYKRYLNLEHNFFEVDENGIANHNKPHWEEVMNTFIEWTL
ncbi:hypothetical protein [Empedobacter falsenii]